MPIKRFHEFRDPLHGFIVLDRQERAFVDSDPFQRLRHVNQLAMTSLVYPGATHKRFEHSIGVCELAKSVFDVVTDPSNVHPSVERIIPDPQNLSYWRTVISLAALAHDIGHLPFSHAAEKRILPKDLAHEDMTLALLNSREFDTVWSTGQRVQIDDVKKLSVGQKKLKGVAFTTWESILSEIITGDSFGVDRIDYLLRDSFHAGVSYGKFDHQKLISSLRILPSSEREGESTEPALGVELNGLHSAEALLLARYFMYEQVYFHPVRRAYDIHLTDYMVAHYGEHSYPLDADFHLKQSDNEVMSAIREDHSNVASSRHLLATPLISRGHFRHVYGFNPTDRDILEQSISEGKILPEEDKPISPAYLLKKELDKVFGEARIKIDLYIQGSSPAQFPVIMPDGRIESSENLSPILENFPLMTVDSIYASPEKADEVRIWIGANRERVLRGEIK